MNEVNFYEGVNSRIALYRVAADTRRSPPLSSERVGDLINRAQEQIGIGAAFQERFNQRLLESLHGLAQNTRVNRNQISDASSDSSSESGDFAEALASRVSEIEDRINSLRNARANRDQISDTSSDSSSESGDFVEALASRVSGLFFLKVAVAVALLGVAETKASLVFIPGYVAVVLGVTISIVTVVALVALYEEYKRL